MSWMLERAARAAITLVACFAVAAFAGACDRDASSPAGPSSRGGTAPVSAKDIADESLPADQYVEMGLPSHDRPWSGHDLKEATAKLEELAAASPQQLPRRGSDKSGAAFARLVARDNLDFFRDRSLPLSTRFPDALDFLQSQNQLLKLYANAMDRRKVTGEEVVDLMAADLAVVQVMLELVDEFWPTIPKDDPKYEVRLHGLETMRQGLATVVSGVLIALTESHLYDVESRRRLVARSLETFPAIVPKLSKPSQTEVRRRLAELAGDPKVSELRPQLVELRDAVDRAVRDAANAPQVTPP